MINNPLHRPLNGTPISSVQHVVGDRIKWHVIYIDENYFLRERIAGNTTSNTATYEWKDGPLSSSGLKTFEAARVGMTACYFGDYYGQYSDNGTQATAGINLSVFKLSWKQTEWLTSNRWFATDGSTLSQYTWTNGTAEWRFVDNLQGSNGHASVGCLTWYGLSKYSQEVDPRWPDLFSTVPFLRKHQSGARLLLARQQSLCHCYQKAPDREMDLRLVSLFYKLAEAFYECAELTW